MKTLTTKQLASKLAGGDSFIRTKNKVVKGLAITTEKNPEAPEIIIVGKGPRIVSNVKLLLRQQNYVPIYVKQTVNAWKYLGEYKADRYSQDKKTIEKHRKHRSVEKIDGILFLSSYDDLSINVKSRYFPDKDLRKKIEVAAINYVTNYYKNLGFRVTDCQRDNCGYDLLIQNKRQILKIEVKGTSGAETRFFLSRNERLRSADPLWHLAIVTDALVKPALSFLTSSEMEKKFNFEALCWECTLKK